MLHLSNGEYQCPQHLQKKHISATVYGKKSFLSKESDTKTLQSIHFAYEVGIISSLLQTLPVAAELLQIYCRIRWQLTSDENCITFRLCTGWTLIT